MTKSEKPVEDPPGLPEVSPRLRLYLYQWIGLFLLALFPALAIAGVFGPSFHTEQVSAEGIDVFVRYPTRLRYKQVESIEVRIENRSQAAFDTLQLSLDSAFARGFSDVRGTPPFELPYVMGLPGIGPGESRLAVIELEADRYGRQAGDLRISAGAHLQPHLAPVPLSIFVLP